MTTNEYIKGVKNGFYPAFNGHVWQRNYYEHIIRNEDDLNEIRKYIEANPSDWREE
jgi:REP element-mobilizing transposase RayT